MQQTEWVYCPVCGNKTRDRIREDTVLINYPLYCPKCKRKSLIQAKQLQALIICAGSTLAGWKRTSAPTAASGPVLIMK